MHARSDPVKKVLHLTVPRERKVVVIYALRSCASILRAIGWYESAWAAKVLAAAASSLKRATRPRAESHTLRMGKKSKKKIPEQTKKEASTKETDERAKKMGPIVTLDQARADQKEMEEWAKSQGLSPPITLCIPLGGGPATMFEPEGRER